MTSLVDQVIRRTSQNAVAAREPAGLGTKTSAVILLLALLTIAGAEPPAPRDSIELGDSLIFRDLTLSPDGKTLAVTGRLDGVVTLWDLATKKTTAVLKPKGAPACGPPLFTTDGKSLIVGGIYDSGFDDNNKPFNRICVNVWDLATHKERRALAAPKNVSCDWVATADGKSLILGTAPSGIVMFDLESGKQTKAIQWDAVQATDWVSSLALSPDGKTLAVGMRWGTLLLCDLEKGEIRHTISEAGTDYPNFSADGISQFAFSPDGKRLITRSSGGLVVKVWDPATGKTLDSLRVGHGAQNVRALALSPDGKTLALASPSKVELWDFGMGGVRDDFSVTRLVPGKIEFLAFTPDGKTLLSLLGSKLEIWDVPAGAPKSVLPNTNDPPFIFTPPPRP